MAEMWGDETRWCLVCGNGDEKATCAECGGTGWHLTDAGRGLVRLLDALGVEREQTRYLDEEPWMTEWVLRPPVLREDEDGELRLVDGTEAGEPLVREPNEALLRLLQQNFFPGSDDLIVEKNIDSQAHVSSSEDSVLESGQALSSKPDTPVPE